MIPDLGRALIDGLEALEAVLRAGARLRRCGDADPGSRRQARSEVRRGLGKIFSEDDTFWGEDVVICCSYEAKTPDGFVFWRPALTAIEPACSLYDDARLNRELRKTTNYVLDGFHSLEG